MTNAEIYRKEIEPLIAEIGEICKRHNFEFVGVTLWISDPALPPFGAASHCHFGSAILKMDYNKLFDIARGLQSH